MEQRINTVKEHAYALVNALIVALVLSVQLVLTYVGKIPVINASTILITAVVVYAVTLLFDVLVSNVSFLKKYLRA